MLEEKGISYISTIRPPTTRGGGAALASSLKFFSMSKCDIIPHEIEAAWGILRPKFASKKLTEMICCAFYSHPVKNKNKALLEHLTITLQSLL